MLKLHSRTTRYRAPPRLFAAAGLALAAALSDCAAAPDATTGAFASAAPAAPVAQTAAAQAQPVAGTGIAKGQKIVMATHSFNVFIGPTRQGGASPGPLAALAAERGKDGHEMLAVQMIGGSTPMQHWNQGGDNIRNNIAKAALTTHGEAVDVFTMSPNAIMPEPGIDLFGDFVMANNPNARIMVQASWSAYDGKGATPSVGGTGGGDFSNTERNDITVEDLDRWLNGQETRGDAYLPRLRTQLEGIDKRAGREITHVVPSSTAVYTLRKEVLAGNVPGVAKQSELFRDPIGHATQPTSNLVTYVWYAAMYRESPVGLQALVNPADPSSAARERVLQQIAWNAVVGEPKSGVKGEPVPVG